MEKGFKATQFVVEKLGEGCAADKELRRAAPLMVGTTWNTRAH